MCSGLGVARACDAVGPETASGDVALGVSFGGHGIVDDILRGDLARALDDPHVALQQQVVRRFVQRTVVGVDDRVGLHVMHVTDRLIFFGLTVDLRFVGR